MAKSQQTDDGLSRRTFFKAGGAAVAAAATVRLPIVDEEEEKAPPVELNKKLRLGVGNWTTTNDPLSYW